MTWATDTYGISVWGHASVLVPATVRALGDFEFSVVAKTEGYANRVYYSAPAAADAPEWSRRLRILRKRGEWPQSWDDADADVLVDDVFPVIAQSYFFDDENLEAGVIYYYALFQERIDSSWVSDVTTDRDSAYPYERWGFPDYMFQTLPRGFRTQDVDSNHLYQFLTILGALLDNTKTDVEHLRTLMEIDHIHDDLLYLIDMRLGWPTWFAAGGLQRRQDTKRAVDLYKLLGRAVSYEQMLEAVSDWEAVIVEGWRYVMFSNGRFDSTTPDTTNPDLIRLIGRQGDLLKYVNDTNGWHSVNGLGFYLEEIPAVSAGLTTPMIDRFQELIEWGKASFVSYQLVVRPVSEEEFPLESFVLEEAITIRTPHIDPLIEELPWTTSSWALFTSLDSGSTTNTATDRTFHNDIEYI